MKTAFLFPGQGSQHAGMLQAFDDKNGGAEAAFREFEAVLQRPIKGFDTEEMLNSTINTQLCLLLSGVISARILLAQGVTADYVAGHSVGTFAAATISGVITLEQALILVHKRAVLMNTAFPEGYGMTALLGFSVERLISALTAHNLRYPPVYLANINAADQLVVSGRNDSMQSLVTTLSRNGLQKAKLLRVAVPSHCELLSTVSVELKKMLDDMTLNEPVIPYVADSTGRLLLTADDIRRDLWINISTTVKWYDAVTLIYERGARILIEMSPSGVLTKIAEASFPEAHTIGASETHMDQAVILWNAYLNNNI
jgi:malonate decarboxylase epsilon subunit